MRIARIRINHLLSPMGVEGKPVFSWINEGFVQKSYRITVSSGNDILWDSGIVMDPCHSSVEYEGSPLPSLSECTLTIEADGVKGTSTFVTGCPELGERSSWIHDDSSPRYDLPTFVVSGNLNGRMHRSKGFSEAVYLKKDFRASKAVKEAYLAVCGLGFYHALINGTNVGTSLLQPAQTDYSKRALYNVFNVTELIERGRNSIMLVLGNGRLIEAYGYDSEPKAIMLLRLRYSDGSVEDVVSDSSFLASSGPIGRNSIYEGTIYDARKKLRFAHNASTIEGYPLEAEMLPPIRETETERPRSIRRLENGSWIIDFGQNSSGIYRIRMKGRRGETVRMRFSELADENGLSTETARDAHTEDVYISDGTERIYQPCFTYHGFRYMEVSGISWPLLEEDVEKVVLHTDLEPVGTFACSDPFLTRIHECVRWSQRSNSMGIPTDCPQREERMGWLGDVQLASRQAVLDFDMAAFYRKFLDDIRLSQLEDGQLSDVTPPYWRLYPADPIWGSAYPTLLWRLYEEYGDKQALRKHYSGVRKYVDWLDGMKDDDGTIHGVGKYGDWCAPTATHPKKISTDFTSTWFLMKDTLVLSWIASVLGNEEDRRIYEERFDALRKAFLKRFDDNGRFQSSGASPADKLSVMTGQVLPLALGIVPDEEKEKAVEELMLCVRKRYDYHIDCGIAGLRYLFDVLLDNGLDEAAYRIMAQRTYPGLGYMVANGATTLWERWEYLTGVGMNSHNHIMYGSPNAWFYQGLCGIRRMSAEKWKIHPYFPSSMGYAYASTMSAGGPISVYWRCEGRKVRVTVELPLEYSALFIPPEGWKADVEELSGKSQYEIMLRKV